MIVTIHQPEHLPWLGFFNKMASAEIFVILDNVQYRKNYFQNRNRIRGSNGPQWIGIPVETKGHMDVNICDIKVAEKTNPKWKEKYLRTIEYGYCKHPYFKEYFSFFEQLMSGADTRLMDYNLKIIFHFAELLGLHPNFIMASSLGVQGSKTDLIYDICEKLGASTYVSGPSGRDYLNIDVFQKRGIEVVYNDFIHPNYKQHKEENFTPYLSILDLFMNIGACNAKELVCKPRFWNLC